MPVVPVRFAIPGIVITGVLRNFGEEMPEHFYYEVTALGNCIHDKSDFIKVTTEHC